MASGALWNGKERRDMSGMDPEELNPVITYRHLLSSGLGVRNPLRVIGLCDMDAFYAACEMARLGIDPSIPLVVRQWDSLIAVNYPARSYGISRMDKVASALERCPHLRVVHVATYDPSTPDAKPAYTDNPDSQTHKVSLDHYRRESKKIIEVFKDVLPEAEIERASIDEAFIDFTEPIRQHILAHFPHLATTPHEGLDRPLPPPPSQGIPLTYPPSRVAGEETQRNIWTALGTLVPVSGAPAKEPASIGVKCMDGANGSAEQAGAKGSDGDDDGGSPSTSTLLTLHGRLHSADAEDVDSEEGGHGQHLHDAENHYTATTQDLRDPSTSSDENRPPTWHDVSLSIAASLMLKIRDEVKRRLGYTTSAGIARNKFLAKLIASYKKRDSQSILRNAAIPNYLGPLPFQKIRFLGGKLGTAIAEAYDAKTVDDLLDISIEEMQRKFGESSIWVWEALRGIDRSEVKEKPPVTKSMGASKNLQHPIAHPSEGAHWLRILAGELAFRLVEARQDNPGLWPKTLALHVTQAYSTSRSKQASFPFTRCVTTEFICKAAEKLWAELVGTSAEYDRNKAKGKATGMKITNVFLGFAGVEVVAAGQQTIEGFFPTPEAAGKRNRGDNEGDKETKKRKRSGVDDDVGLVTPSVSTVSFRCPRCGNKEVRRDFEGTTDREEAIMSALKMEHDDFHFARDLARSDTGSVSGTGKSHNTHSDPKKEKEKKKEESKGIAKFFSVANSKK